MVGLEAPPSSLTYKGVVAFKQSPPSVQNTISEGGNCVMREHDWYKGSTS